MKPKYNDKDEIYKIFLKEVSNHKLEVKLDSEVYRHLVFSNNGSSIFKFEIITTPGLLTIHGDMGTWSYSRLNDMFEFFRDKEDKINLSYYAEKLKMGSDWDYKNYMDYDGDLFKENMLKYINDYFNELDDDEQNGFSLSKEERKAEVLEDLGFVDFDNQHEAFSYVYNGFRIPFDFCDISTSFYSKYNYHYIWCLFAIVWGINRYDEYNRHEKLFGRSF
jgi:hypothetical protein